MSLADEFSIEVTADLDRYADTMVGILKKRAPFRDGLLRSRIRSGGLRAPRSRVKTVSFATETNMDYPSFLDGGTRPHVIRIKTKKVLASYQQPGVADQIFGTVVNHPGSTKDVGWWSDAPWDEELRKALT